MYGQLGTYQHALQGSEEQSFGYLSNISSHTLQTNTNSNNNEEPTEILEKVKK